MTTFSFSSGDPTHLTSGANALMVDLSGPFADIRARLNSSGLLDENDITAAMVQKLGLSNALTTGRGKSIIATTESRTNVAYGTLTTPDQVASVVLPTDGLICVLYQATWQESVANAARAAIFVGATQQKLGVSTAVGPVVVEALTDVAATAAKDQILTTWPGGLASGQGKSSIYPGDVTTGQAIGGMSAVVGGGTDGTPTLNMVSSIGGFITAIPPSFGECKIFAAAGTYTVSIQFKSTSGSVTAKNRKLWVWTLGF